MNRQIGFDRKFSLLTQEAYLAKNTLLSGFDLLLKANLFQDKDGYFYSAFFHISIGMERIMKLAVVTHYMLSNNYQTPTIKQLKVELGHDIKTLYRECQKLMTQYCNTPSEQSLATKSDEHLVEFFTEYASAYGSASRYFNLNKLCEENMDRSPLDKWLDLARSIYGEYTSHQAREKSALNLMYRMDKEGPPNGFTFHLNEQGHPMTVFDCLHCQYVIKKSTPLAIWRIIEILQPIHLLLEAMAYKATDYEVKNNIKSMTIPHYEDFFYFLLADKASIKKRKKWLDTFNK